MLRRCSTSKGSADQGCRRSISASIFTAVGAAALLAQLLFASKGRPVRGASSASTAATAVVAREVVDVIGEVVANVVGREGEDAGEEVGHGS